MKQLFTTLVAFFLLTTTKAQKGLVPAQYQSIAEAYGDLNKDGIEEKVVVYNVKEQEEEMNGIDRELIIFRRVAGAWTIWQRSLKAVGNSRDGGMMGDPFQEVEVKNGVLLITEAGGSSWKWGHTDKYRYQNGSFELIGYNNTYGKLCEYWADFDFNIMTGKIVFTKEYESCEEEGEQVVSKRENETFTYRLQKKITLQNRKDAEVQIISPKYKHELYL